MEYRVLGPLEVSGEDGSRPLGGSKQRALLALLLLNANRVVSRERLVDALWGDNPPATAVETVQVYISRLRKLLPESGFVTRPPGYVLELDLEDLDVTRFERLVAAARAGGPKEASRLLREALGLWRGPALAELDEDFARVESARLDDLRVAALEERIDADLALGLHADVVGELEALISDYPQRERLRGQMMLALYRSERQAEALEAYREARVALDEVGLEPSDRLRELERSILTQDPALALPRPVVADRVPLPGPVRAGGAFPFIGRDREMARLKELLTAVERGDGGQIVLIRGEAGEGKTRLVRELAHDAADRNGLVLYGAARPDVNVPYQPFVDIMEFLVRVAGPDALRSLAGSEASHLGPLIPVLSSAEHAGGDPLMARRRLHAAITTLLDAISRERPVLLIVEDMHWADAPSIDLLRDLSRAVPEARILLVVTCRERTEDARPELAAALAELARHEGLTRLRPGPFEPGEIASFVAEVAAGSPSDELVEALGYLTGGTPFLVCELWRTLEDAERIEVVDGVVEMIGPVEALDTPEPVRDVIEYRISRLSNEASALLEVAAVVGLEFELSLLGNPIDAAAEAAASGMVEAVPDDAVAYRFTHELVRRALYDRLPTVRRAELHLRVGERLEAAHALDPARVVSVLAHHFTLAAPVGGRERAVDYNLRAAAAAMEAFAFANAAGNLSIALDLGVDGPALAGVLNDLGLALLYAGRPAEAEAALARAANEAKNAGDAGRAAHAAIVSGYVRMRGDVGADHEEIRSTAESAIETFTQLGDQQGLAHAWRLLARVELWHCRWAAVDDALEQALLHVPAGSSRERALIDIWRILSWYSGPTPVPEALRRCRDLIAEYAEDHKFRAAASCFLCPLLAMSGAFDEARATGLAAIELTERLVGPVAAGPGRNLLGQAELSCGEAAAALEHTTIAYALLIESGDQHGALLAQLRSADALCALGRVSECERVLRECRPGVTVSDVQRRVLGASVESRLAVATGRADVAERIARHAVDLGRASDGLAMKADATLSLANALAALGRKTDCDEARAAAERLQEQKGNRAGARHARDVELPFVVVA